MTLGNKAGAHEACSLKCPTCIGFLTMAVTVASTALPPAATDEGPISPKGVGRAQRLLANRGSEPRQSPLSSLNTEEFWIQPSIRSFHYVVWIKNKHEGKENPGVGNDKPAKFNGPCADRTAPSQSIITPMPAKEVRLWEGG